MRIVDEWNMGHLKLTLFVMNERFSLKIERDILEQWYKFRDGQVKSSSDLKALLDKGFYDKVNSIFDSMFENRSNILLRDVDESDEFDTII